MLTWLVKMRRTLVWRPPEPLWQPAAESSAESSCATNMDGCLVWFWPLKKDASVLENTKVGKLQPRELSNCLNYYKQVRTRDLGKEKESQKEHNGCCSMLRGMVLKLQLRCSSSVLQSRTMIREWGLRKQPC